MTRLQLGPITTISHSLQVTGLANAGTATRSYSQSVRQATDGLTAPLPPSPFSPVQRDGGWTRVLLAEFLWGFVGLFFGSLPIFSP